MRLLLILFAFPALAQITPSATSVKAQVPGLSCVFTAAGGICTVTDATGAVLPYDLWTPPLVNGADASNRGFEWNGAVINPTLHMRNGVVSWALAIQPNGGVWSRLTGVFSVPGPPVVGPVTAGVIEAGVCQTRLAAFQLTSDGKALLSAQAPGSGCVP